MRLKLAGVRNGLYRVVLLGNPHSNDFRRPRAGLVMQMDFGFGINDLRRLISKMTIFGNYFK